MARRLFDMIDIVEVLQHWYSGRSKTDVATSLGIDRGTIRKYVTPAETAGMTSWCMRSRGGGSHR